MRAVTISDFIPLGMIAYRTILISVEHLTSPFLANWLYLILYFSSCERCSLRGDHKHYCLLILMPSSLIEYCPQFGRNWHYRENGRTIFLGNVCRIIPDYTSSYFITIFSLLHSIHLIHAKLIRNTFYISSIIKFKMCVAITIIRLNENVSSFTCSYLNNLIIFCFRRD
jgi:hypothetical protein